MLEPLLKVTYFAAQRLVLLSLVGKIGLELDILVNHVLYTFFRTILQSLVKEMDLEFQIKVLLGKLVDLAVLLFQGEITTWAIAERKRV